MYNANLGEFQLEKYIFTLFIQKYWQSKLNCPLTDNLRIQTVKYMYVHTSCWHLTWLFLLDHSNHYIYYPLGSWIDSDILHISEKLTFITPDMISLSHVMVAAFGAKFLASELLLHRRLGVLLFELRSFLGNFFSPRCIKKVSINLKRMAKFFNFQLAGNAKSLWLLHISFRFLTHGNWHIDCIVYTM